MIISFLFIVIIIALQRKLVGAYWLANISTWYLLLFFAMDFIGIHILFFQEGLSVPVPLWFILYLLPIVVLGSHFVPVKLSMANLTKDNLFGSKSLSRSLLICMIMSLILLGYYLSSIPRIPLWVAIAGSGDIADVRADVMAWGGNTLLKYLYLLFVRYMLPLIAIFAWVDYKTKAGMLNKYILPFLLILTYLVLIVDGQKAQIVFFSVQLYIATTLLRRREGKPSDINWRRLFLNCFIVVVGFETMIVMYYFFMKGARAGGATLWEAQGVVAEAIIRRITITQARPLLVIFTDFPDKVHYLWGKTLPFCDLIGLGARFDISEYAYRQIYGDFSKVGAASTLFVSEYYSDFGFLGAVSSAIGISFIVTYFAQHRNVDKMTRVYIVVYSYLAGYIMRLAITQLVMGIAMPVIAVLFFFGLRRVVFALNGDIDG